MQIINKSITKKELSAIAKKLFGNFVKAVVDVEKKIMAIDGELHSDEEALLLQQGSQQKNLWGVNLYPEENEENFIEFDSMINVRPSVKNMSRGVKDKKIRSKIISVIHKLVR